MLPASAPGTAPLDHIGTELPSRRGTGASRPSADALEAGRRCAVRNKSW
jgi:hypothetical protein